MIASFGFQYLATWLGTSQILNTYLVFGGLIIFFVVAMPAGLLPSLQAAAGSVSAWLQRLRAGRRPDARQMGAQE